MKVEGSYSFKAGRERVWEMLQNPDVLVTCIPGCDGFTDLGEDSYDIQIKAKVGPITGAYTGRLSVSEKSPPDSYKLLVEGGGAMGTARGEAVLRLSESDGETTVEVEADAQVTGMVARVGQRFMGSASKMLMNQFFECMKSRIEG
jgi:carbon monoxide dehydrogenase subunit G